MIDDVSHARIFYNHANFQVYQITDFLSLQFLRVNLVVLISNGLL